MKNIIKIKIDIAKEVRELSRKHFKGSKRGNFAHKDKTKYTRKTKHPKT